MNAKDFITANLTGYALGYLLFFVAVPAWSQGEVKQWILYKPGETRSGSVARGRKPVPGTNVPGDTIVCDVPPGKESVHPTKFERQPDNTLIEKDPPPPAKTQEQIDKEAQEAQQRQAKEAARTALKDAAAKPGALNADFVEAMRQAALVGVFDEAR